ncbi:MAG: aspartate aminotransferase family protein [Candidatus Dormibacteraeota bacterium]|uniref:Aspartate aminotransferase family protein n=1 Tax=Candidatus Amunia macphersoniae TaxID=3127014 RepID=A0A934N8T8_9BACT|nr:aspartate aminotransferase family protein [Candidatus Dormibacteraeota bacterium]
MWQQATGSMPRGVPSSFQDTPPQPVFIDRGEGSRVWDVDGNEYVDFHNGFGVMVVGHAHPSIVGAVNERMSRGSHFAQPVAQDIEVATELGRRFAQPQWRFTNSGTESTLDAVRLARGFTGRERLIKIEASYHGHHDSLLVSVEPARDLMGPVDQPNSVKYCEGIPQAMVDLVTVVPFNDLEALERAFAAHHDVAAVVLEPVMMNIGIVLPDQGYLAGVREIAHRHDALLIFDEVKTGVTIAAGGATERFGVVPDIVCLAKAIGGGLPCGAIGGRADVMAAITDGRVAQMGTFNGNPLTTAASRATLYDVLTPAAYAHFDALAEDLQGGLDAVIADHELPFHVLTLAARGCVTYRKEPVRNYRDYLEIDNAVPYLSWLYQTNRGVLMAPGAEENWTLSVQHTDSDARRYVENFKEFARDLTGA